MFSFEHIPDASLSPLPPVSGNSNSTPGHSFPDSVSAGEATVRLSRRLNGASQPAALSTASPTSHHMHHDPYRLVSPRQQLPGKQQASLLPLDNAARWRSAIKLLAGVQSALSDLSSQDIALGSPSDPGAAALIDAKAAAADAEEVVRNSNISLDSNQVRVV